jgi:hypothetical protein
VVVIARGSAEMYHPGNALATTGMTTLDRVGEVEGTPPNTPTLLRIDTPGIVTLRTISTILAQRMNAQHRTAPHQALETRRHPRQPLQAVRLSPALLVANQVTKPLSARRTQLLRSLSSRDLLPMDVSTIWTPRKHKLPLTLCMVCF